MAEKQRSRKKATIRDLLEKWNEKFVDIAITIATYSKIYKKNAIFSLAYDILFM